MKNFQKKLQFVPKYEQSKKNLYAQPKFMLPPDAAKLPKPFNDASNQHLSQEQKKANDKV